MLKKMRWRFTGAAMSAIIVVVLVLLCIINIWNYQIVTNQLDQTLQVLQTLNPIDLKPFNPGGRQRSEPFGGLSAEMRYMLRYFSVDCDAQGNILAINREYIASVSPENAAQYTSDILQSGKTRGYYNGFRYIKTETDLGTTIVFLNAEREIQSIERLLLVSGTVALVSLLIVFGLVLLFSKKAIAPYVRNIETQKRFITDAGHELKTPLTAISTSADILSIEHADDEWVRNIQTQCIRLSKLVSNLVMLSRLDEENPFPEKSDFSLSEAIWEICEPVSSLAKAKGKAYTQNIEENVAFHGDKAAVQQMVSILLDNAVKYSDEGGWIHLALRKKQRKIEIQVANSCALSDTMDVDHLFDRFYRPDQSRSVNSGGTGIGLSIAKATAEAHGGKISARVSGGDSITFTVTL